MSPGCLRAGMDPRTRGARLTTTLATSSVRLRRDARVTGHVAPGALRRGLRGTPRRGSAARAPQPGPDRGRRPRGRRARLLRAGEDRDAEARRHGARGAALHALLRGGAGVRAGALLAPDRAARRARLRARQPGAPGRGPGPAPEGHAHPAEAPAARRLRDRDDRQVGPRRTEVEWRAERAGLRPVVRLLLPAPGADLLSRSPVARRQ